MTESAQELDTAPGSRHASAGAPPPIIDAVLGPLVRAPGWTSDLALAALTAVIGWVLRFTQDDAYITLRYSRNLADGHGLVFNRGERVEGYTNFLWTWWLSIPHRLDVDPVLWSDISSIAAGVATVLILRRVARRVIPDERWVLVAIGLLVAFHSFAVYLTGGLETQWQTAFVMLTVASLLRAAQGPDLDLGALVVASIGAGLALLTRLDSVVLVVAAGLPAALALRRRDQLGIAALGATLGPAAAVVGPWLVWKWGYYGDLLPNTFVAKQTPLHWAVVRGLMFLALFVLVTFLFVALPLVRAGWAATERTLATRTLRAVIGAWLVYLLWVGADFMEFRFLVPVLPMGAVLFTAALRFVPPSRAMTAIAVVVVGSLVKWYAFYPAVLGIESARALEEHVEQPAGWLDAGTVLAQDFPEGEQGGPTIAVTAAGALPYASRLRTIDMLGLTDVGANEAANRWELTKLKAGHEHIATVDYLVETGTDLVLGGLITERCDDLDRRPAIDVVRDMFLTYDVQPDDIPPAATLRAIPLGQRDRCLYALDLADPAMGARFDAAGYEVVGRLDEAE